MQGVSERLRELVDRLAPGGRWTDVGWDHGESEVWRVDGAFPLFVKRHRSVRKHRQELRAYRDWLPRHPGRHPELLGHDDRVLVLQGLPGDLVQDLPPDDARLPDLHRQAGRWLRTLHHLPFTDDDPMPLDEALQRRLAGWRKRAGPHIAPEILERIHRNLASLPFGALARVPCHRDFSPRNLLVDGADLGVIDLEHAHPDVFLVDLVKLVAEAWVERPDLERAFYDGYGRGLDADEARLLDVLVALYGVGTVAWAVEHRDPAFEGLGRTMLDRVLT